MPFYVAVHHQALPGRLEQLLTTIKADLAASPTSQPGRRFTRVFEQLHEPARLLSIEEWLSQGDYERHAQSPAYVEAIRACGAPPRAEALERLQMYRHMSRPPSALACATLTTPLDRAAGVESFICDEERREALVATGLVLRAIYRVIDSPGRLLVLHGWRSREDLDRYLASTARATVATLAARGVSIEQFTGQMAAQFSWLES
jgi:quinol monooxygenase YgiN